MKSPLFSTQNVQKFFAIVNRTVLWGALAILLIINVLLFKKITISSLPIIYNVITSPLSSSLHNRVASFFWKSGLKQQATEEALLAQNLSSSESSFVLGTSTIEDVVAQWKSTEKQDKATLAHWISITKQKPDYRDAYVQGAYIAFKLQNFPLSKQLIDQSLRLDPNYPPSLSLLGALKMIEKKK